MTQFEPFVTPEDVAEFLKVTPATVRAMARSKKIPAHAICAGSRNLWRFRLSELKTHFDNLMAGAIK